MPDEIQWRALETWYENNNSLHYEHLPATMGLVGEAGEFNDLLKKILFKPGYLANKDALLDELGDVLFYLAILAYQLGVTLDELSRLNHAKLISRENDGTGYNRGEPAIAEIES